MATVDELVEALDAGQPIVAESPLHQAMHGASQDALKITAELNTGYHKPAEVTALLSRLWRAPVDETVRMFPPFHTDFGKNTTVHPHMFINMGCTFQDQGGVIIGEGSLIGHNTLIATLNHDTAPDRRADMHPAPVVIGKNVWIGSNATILPGVSIGDGAVIAAAALVTRDVAPDTVTAGSPARPVKYVRDSE